MLPGVYKNQKKNGETYFRASFTLKNRHISLGSYATEALANTAYNEALKAASGSSRPEEYSEECNVLPLSKYISVINLRDNGVYFATPIYLMKKYFYYYLSETEVLTFDAEDLFYYAHRSIQRRGGRLFVSDYGMQVTLLTRYGVRPYAVKGRDYEFVNGDEKDLRYANLRLLSRYIGVLPVSTAPALQKDLKDAALSSMVSYKVRIHFKGNYTVGSFSNEIWAAIAYNKAADHIKTLFPEKNYGLNFIEDLPAKEYAQIYTRIDISDFIRSFAKRHGSATR